MTSISQRCRIISGYTKTLRKQFLIIYQGQGSVPFVFKWIATPGTLIIAAALLGGLLQGARLFEITGVFVYTLKKVGARVSCHARRRYVHVASAFPLAHHRAVLALGP